MHLSKRVCFARTPADRHGTSKCRSHFTVSLNPDYVLTFETEFSVWYLTLYNTLSPVCLYRLCLQFYHKWCYKYVLSESCSSTCFIHKVRLNLWNHTQYCTSCIDNWITVQSITFSIDHQLVLYGSECWVLQKNKK